MLSTISKHALAAALIVATCGATSLSAQAQQSSKGHAKSSAPVASAPVAAPAPTSDAIPVTTKSDEARRLYEEGLHDEFDLLYVTRGVNTIRQSVKADPQFALGHAML